MALVLINLEKVDKRDIQGEKLLHSTDKRWKKFLASVKLRHFLAHVQGEKVLLDVFSKQSEIGFFIAATIKRIILQGEREKVLDDGMAWEFMQILLFRN